MPNQQLLLFLLSYAEIKMRMKSIEKSFLLFFSSFSFFIASAQLTAPLPLPASVQTFINVDTARKFRVSLITIQGNKRTKDYIIRREMRFKEGDSIKTSSLVYLLEQSRSLIYNTVLFTEVNIIPSIDSTGIAFNVYVKEKWYLYPSPQFKLVDRNLNEWLKRYNGDLNRVIYGAKFAHYNFTGRRDQLRIYFLTGYARNISFSYKAPYSNSALTEGYAVSAGYTQNREVGYKTNSGNLILNYTNGAFVRKSFNLNAGYIIRRGHYNSHVLGIGYAYLKVDDSVIVKSASDYFNSNKSSAAYTDLTYAYQHVKVDNISYPLKGNVYGFSLFKRGLGFSGGINLLEIGSYGTKYIPHGKNWYSSVQLVTKLKAPFDVAYINRHAMGFGDFDLRGLEYYVIDGVAAAIAKYTLKKKIIAFNIPVPFKIKAIPKIPVALFAKTFADAGYSYIPSRYNSVLNNRLLYTGGFGLDILTLYDISFKLEYSFNQLGQNGLFLHVKGGF